MFYTIKDSWIILIFGLHLEQIIVIGKTTSIFKIYFLKINFFFKNINLIF